MRGLLKNDFYASLSNCAVFAGINVLLGIAVAAIGNEAPTLLTRYAWMCIIGFSYILMDSLGRERGTKWTRYKLTMPVKRADIVAGNYISTGIGIAAVTVFWGIIVCMSIILHGFLFDKKTDIINIFACGTGISLFMGAIFFPLSYLGGDERRGLFLFISTAGAAGIFVGLVGLVNAWFGTNMSEAKIVMGAMILFCCALAAFAASFPLTVWILKRKG